MQIKSLKGVVLTCILLASLQGVSQPPSLPQGASGKGASIATTGTTMTITPTQARTWIDWQSYNVGAGHKVVYDQGPSHLTVNNVVGASMSHIAGTIDVKGGHAFLVNPNGIIFTDGAMVQGNMIFSTLPMDRKAFSDRGEILFNGSGLPHIGSISQSGTFESNGLTAFVGPHMALQGKIIAPLQIYAGNKVAAHLGADGLMGFDVTQAAHASKIEVNEVQGQYVIMSAGAVGEAVQSAIHIKGHVAARGMKEEGGHITIYGGDVTLHKTAHLDVDGAKAGGSIRIGVPQGYVKPNKTQLPFVRSLSVEPGARLSARSQEGPGGNIFLLAQQSASFQGSYDVSGLTQGGQIELSSRYNPVWNYEKVLMGGEKAGSLTLDPDTPVSIVWALTPGASNEILATALNQALASGHVTVETAAHPGTDGIVVSNALDGTGEGAAKKAITWSTNNSLSLIGPEIEINGHIIYTGGDGSTGKLNLKTTTEGTGVTGTGTLNFNGGHIRTFNIVPAAVPVAPAITIENDGGPQPVAYALIMTVEHLKAINDSADTLAGNYALDNNIDISGEAHWDPIGTDGAPFTGYFTGDDLHGGNHEIQGLTFTNNADYLGFFGKVETATIDHLGVTGASFNDVTGNYHGALVGRGIDSTIMHSYASGNVVGNQYVGGLVGWIENSTLTHSYASGTVTGSSNYVGGLVGRGIDSTIMHSYATGNVTGNQSFAGGLVGYSSTNTTIMHSYATGNVTGRVNHVGGLVGRAVDTTLTHSYATGNVTGRSLIGGLVGYSSSNTTITHCYASGTVTGQNDLGGLVGRVITSTITHSYATGNVTGIANFLGGLVGISHGSTITLNYATGNVTGTADYLGGLVGYSATNTTITLNYATGTVTGGNYIGGAIGWVNDVNTIHDVYSSGLVNGAAGNNIGGGQAVTYNVGDNGRIALADWFNVDSDIVGHFLDPRVLDEASYAENFVSPWAAVNGVILHLPDTAVPIVRSGEALFDVYAHTHKMPSVTLNGVDHTFIPPSKSFIIALQAGEDPGNTFHAGRNTFLITSAPEVNKVVIADAGLSVSALRHVSKPFADNAAILIHPGEALGSITVLSTGSFIADVAFTLDGNITTDNPVSLDFTGPVTLTSDVSLAGSRNYFTGTIDGPYALTLEGTTAELRGVIGGTTALRQLAVAQGVILGANITTTGTQTYSGAVTLGQNVVLSGPVIFNAALDGAHTLQLGGSATLAAVGQTTPLGQLTVDGNAIFGGDITTTGTQTYSGSVTLGQNVVLGGSVIFNGALDGAHNLQLGGNATLSAVGQTTPLGQLTVDGNAIFKGDITTTGTQTYSGAVTLGQNVVLSGPVIFNAALDGAHTLQLGGSATLAAVGQTTPLGQLTVDGNAIFGGDITTTGTQTYSGSVTLGQNVVLGGSVIFNGALDGAHNLQLGGNATLSAVGQTTPLGQLTVDGNAIFKGDITTTGTQTYSGMKTLQPLQGNEIRLQGVVEGLTLGGDVSYNEDHIFHNGEINYNENRLYYNNVEVLTQQPPEEPAGGGENEAPQGNDPVDEAPVEDEEQPMEEAEDEAEAEETPAEEEEDDEEAAEVEEVDAEAATTTPQQRTQLQSHATIAPVLARTAAIDKAVVRDNPSEEGGALSLGSVPSFEGAERSALNQAFEALEGDDDIGVAG